MSTLNARAPTLLDLVKRLDPNDKIADIGEILNQTNEVLEDLPWIESNELTGHKVTQRVGLPDVYFRQINQPVPVSKSRTVQVTEAVARMEAWSEIDEALMELNGNSAAFRSSESVAFLEAMNQKMATKLFYGTSAAPEEFVGLTSRYSSTSATNGQNVLLGGAGSDTDLTSIWLICWGPATVWAAYPKGTTAGLEHKDLGLQTISGSTAGVGTDRMRVWQEQFIWRCGLVVKDWRYAVRIANIDHSEIVADPGASTFKLLDLMTKALYRIPNPRMGRMGFYMNRTCREMLDIQCQNKTNVLLTMGNEEGRPKTSFRGVPIRTVDVLGGTASVEAVVS